LKPGFPIIDRARLTDTAAVILLAALSTWLLIGDFQVRLADVSTDDGLVAYAIYRLDPDRFRLDEHMHLWVQVAGASMLNWLPALVTRYIGLSAESIAYVAIYLQNILLALAVFHLSRAAVDSRAVAWISAVFTLSAHPHWWNLALYADLSWMPYASWMALPFLVFSASFALQAQPWASGVALLVGGLIHPVLGLVAAGTLVLYVLMRDRKRGVDASTLHAISILALAVVIFMVPALAAMSGLKEASAGRLLKSIVRNGHAFPWAAPHCSYCWNLFIHNLIVVSAFLAIGLGVATKGGDNPKIRPLLLAVTLITIFGAAVHLAAWLIGEPRLMRLIATRASIFLMALFVPVIVATALRRAAKGRWLDRLLAGYVLLLPVAAPFAAAGLAWFNNTRSLSWGAIRVVGLSLFALVLLRHAPLVGPFVDRNLISAGLDSSLLETLFRFKAGASSRVPITVVVWLAGAFAACAALSRRGSSRLFTCSAWAIAIPLIGYLLVSSYQSGAAAAHGEARDYRDVQVWARRHTPPQATFAIADLTTYGGWRNLAQRPVVTPGGVGSFYGYTQRADAYNTRLIEFYKRQGSTDYKSLGASGLLDFAKEFGADFAVRRAEWPSLDLPIAFQNEHFVVYGLR